MDRLVAVLPHLGADRAAIPRSSTIRRRATPRASCSPTARRCSQQIIDGKLLRARATYGFWPATSDGDDIVARSTAESRGSRCCASRRTRTSASRSRTSSRPASDDYLGAFIVTAGLGTDELAGSFETRPRRLHRDHGQGARRSARRGRRRVPAPPRARTTAATADRGADARRDPRREVPRHPPGVRLSRVPGSHAEAARCSRCSTTPRTTASR